jgi:hypothetical protein
MLQAALKKAEVERMRRTIEEQLRSELNDALAKHNKTTWRDMFCCCFPRKQGVSCTAAGSLMCCSSCVQLLYRK